MTTIRRTLPVSSFEELGPRQVKVRASTEALGRDKLVVSTQGIDLGPYRKNPVILWQHMPEHPVAKATAVRMSQDALEADVEFAPEGVSAKADEICGLVKSGIVSGLSIGFEPTETEPIGPSQRKGPQKVVRSELMEISFVSIPANRETLVTQRADDPQKPYGDVDYADPGYQEDGKHRYPIDTEDHIRAAWNYINKEGNAAKYSADEVKKIKAKIVAAWKDKIDPDGPPSAAEKRDEEEAAPASSERAAPQSTGIPARLRQLRRKRALRKVVPWHLRGMYELAHWAHLVDCISNAGVAAQLETALEGDASTIPSQIDAVLENAVEVLIAMAQEEGRELLNNTEVGPDEALDEAGLSDDETVIVLASATPALRRFRTGLFMARAGMMARAGKTLSADTERCMRAALDAMDQIADEHRAAGRTHRAAMKSAMGGLRELLDRAAKPQPDDEDAENADAEDEDAGQEGGGDDDDTPPPGKDKGARSAEYRRRQLDLLRLVAA